MKYIKISIIQNINLRKISYAHTITQAIFLFYPLGVLTVIFENFFFGNIIETIILDSLISIIFLIAMIKLHKIIIKKCVIWIIYSAINIILIMMSIWIL